MKKTLTVLILCFQLGNLLAQVKKDTSAVKGCGCQFQSINQAGLLQGQYEAAGLLQTINGFRFKQWFAGIGVGIDYYRFRTIPVFADIRRNLFNKKSSPFVYTNLGMHFSWVDESRKNPDGWGAASTFGNGIYTDAGLGYSFGFKNKMAFLLSAGYSYRNITEKRTINVWCINPPCIGNTETIKYGLNRLTFKMGFQF
jgi:hypothetical protein